jgi:thiol reductant ABC exporter CydD subunit
MSGRGVVDPRLMAYGRSTRRFLVVTVALGCVAAALVIAQAWLIAVIVAGAVTSGESLADLRRPVALLLFVVVLRAAVAWATEVAADRSSARVKSELRIAVLERAVIVGATGDDRSTGQIVTLATSGVDALDGYFGRYLPQLVLAVIVPVAVLGAVVSQDWLSAAIILVTLPFIPVFMALIGLATRRYTDRQVRTLQRLSGHFLDVVSGLPTLKIFGRSKAQVQTIRDVTDRYRRTTMATLRLAFLSSLVLEFLATISVALVAVSVGLRLLGGHLDLRTALFVLVLAPEAYLPLRLVGTNYHASAEGLSAVAQVFEVLDQPIPEHGVSRAVPDPATAPIAIEDLRVTYPGRERPALDGVSLHVQPGEIVAITGPSGCGKSTLLGVLLGFVAPNSGRVTVGGEDIQSLDPVAWRSHISWVPQRPHLFAASIGDNLRLGRPDAPMADVWHAVTDAGLLDVVTSRPDGLDARIGERGAGISAGERQRLALARAFLRDAPFLLLDEPTANLDGSTEADVVDAVRRLAAGRTVLLVAHRPALLTIADRVVVLAPAEVTA